MTLQCFSTFSKRIAHIWDLLLGVHHHISVYRKQKFQGIVTKYHTPGRKGNYGPGAKSSLKPPTLFFNYPKAQNGFYIFNMLFKQQQQ